MKVEFILRFTKQRKKERETVVLAIADYCRLFPSQSFNIVFFTYFLSRILKLIIESESHQEKERNMKTTNKNYNKE